MLALENFSQNRHGSESKVFTSQSQRFEPPKNGKFSCLQIIHFVGIQRIVNKRD